MANPSSNRICVIVNPAARRASGRGMLERLQALCQHATFKLTSSRGQARAYAEQAVAQGYPIIVAAGGDGTVNEVVNGIGSAPVALGILPVGTVNVFALELGIPFALEKSWELIKRGKSRRIDIATANGHRFVQMGGVGLDAEVVARTGPKAKRHLGPLSYLLTVTQVAARKPPRLRVIPDKGKTVEGSLVLVGNGRLYAGPFAIFSGADLEDGLLDVCVFKQTHYLALIRYFRGILFGSHITFTDVEYFKARSFRVEADRPVPAEVDGELLGYAPCEFSLIPKGLKVIC